MTTLRRVLWTVIFMLGLLLGAFSLPIWIMPVSFLVLYCLLWDGDMPDIEAVLTRWFDFCRRMGGKP